MSTKSFAADLKKTLEGIQASGTALRLRDDLVAYLDGVVSSPGTEVSELDIERYRGELQSAIATAKHGHDYNLEMFRSVISAGQSAIKSSFLLNGGAAVAILAFIGHLTQVNPAKVAAFASILIPFSVGVFAISFTSALTYFSQWLYASEYERSGKWLNAAAVLVGLSSYAAFVWGMCLAYQQFMRYA